MRVTYVEDTCIVLFKGFFVAFFVHSTIREELQRTLCCLGSSRACLFTQSYGERYVVQGSSRDLFVVCST